MISENHNKVIVIINMVIHAILMKKIGNSSFQIISDKGNWPQRHLQSHAIWVGNAYSAHRREQLTGLPFALPSSCYHHCMNERQSVVVHTVYQIMNA